MANGRICRACGRRLNPDEHDVDGTRLAITADSKGMPRKVRNWVCRVRAIAEVSAPILGTGERKVTSTFIPDSMQRTRKHNERFVPIAVLEARKR